MIFKSMCLFLCWLGVDERSIVSGFTETFLFGFCFTAVYACDSMPYPIDFKHMRRDVSMALQDGYPSYFLCPTKYFQQEYKVSGGGIACLL